MKHKQRGSEHIDTFPSTKNPNDKICVVEAPTFRPSEKDFQDPLEYIEKIKLVAERFGICKVVPPANFKVSVAR